VLRPTGRFSIFEPINQFAYPKPPQRFFGYEVSPVQHLTQKVVAVYGQADCDPMLDFDERDLLRFAEQAGFEEVHLELQTTIRPATKEDAAGEVSQRWETFLQSSPNPLVPTFEETMQQALTAEEREQLTAHLRPLVETNFRRLSVGG
jgi:arsenite methyltransferase